MKKPSLSLFIVSVGLSLLVLLAALAARSSIIEKKTDAGVLEEVVQEDKSKEEIDTLPEGFPVDFPIYNSAFLIESWNSQGQDITAYSVVWESEETVPQVSDYFLDELVKSGYKIISESKLTDSHVITFEKEQNEGFVGIAKDKDKVKISVTIGVKENEN